MQPAAPLYSTLLQIDPYSYPNIIGDVASEWTISPDGLTYTIKLRPGLKFHDGSPVRSQDVIPSIQRWAKMDGGGKRLAALDMKLTAVDQSTFTLTLREPFPATPAFSVTSSKVRSPRLRKSRLWNFGSLLSKPGTVAPFTT